MNGCLQYTLLGISATRKEGEEGRKGGKDEGRKKRCFNIRTSLNDFCCYRSSTRAHGVVIYKCIQYKMMSLCVLVPLPTLEGAWVDNLQCSGHTLAEDNLAYVTKGTRELQRQTYHVILQQRDSQQPVS